MKILKRKAKLTFLIALIILTHDALAQQVLIDERDSSAYQLVEIGDRLWFRENLKFVTPTSWCGENPSSEACKNGNYYYPADIINVCPVNWKVPSWDEYREAIKIVEKHYGQEGNYQPGKIPLKNGLRPDIENILELTLLSDSTFFNLIATGWIQGNKWKPQDQTTMWVVQDISNIPQPHVHISNSRILMHSHEHHVTDKPKKKRRFSVRCIQEEKK